MPTPDQIGDTEETHVVTLPGGTDDLDSGPRMVFPGAAPESAAYQPNSPAQAEVRTDLGVALQPEEGRVSGISLSPESEPVVEGPDAEQAPVLDGESGVMTGQIADTGISLEEKPTRVDERETELELGDFTEGDDELNTDFIFGDDDFSDATPWIGPEDGNS